MILIFDFRECCRAMKDVKEASIGIEMAMNMLHMHLYGDHILKSEKKPNICPS